MTLVAAVPHVLVVDDDRAFRHAVDALLRKAGYATAQVGDGIAALTHLSDQRVDLVLLDIGLPGMNGLEVLAEARRLAAPPRIVIITSDDTPEALMASFRGQADRFVRKPITPQRIVEVVKEVLAVSAATALPIEVVSATPDWVELVAPCSLDVADRIQEFVMNLNADVPEDTRESVGQAFRELLTNAIEWGGRLDPSQQVRISCLRTKRMRLYRIADPGEGFDVATLPHAAVSNSPSDPLEHARVREGLGLRPGGLGLLISRALVDEVIYNEKRNEVVLVKYLD
ncbi:MAG: response regulator [Acidobacteria bacterium]|nr:response regulator [Acidobacteriota bacterium]